MHRHRYLYAALVVNAVTLSAERILAQQDGLVAYPDVYRVQFENDWVRLVRVTVPGSANLAAHSHPPGYMLHVYFNDAEPIVFEHDGFPFTVTRPPVTARSYRIGRATPETHAVVNTSTRATDYMRVEFRTASTSSVNRRIFAPPLPLETSSVVEVDIDHYRASRITVAPGDSVELVAAPDQPVLLLALTNRVTIDGTPAPLILGQEHFMASGTRATMRNTSTAAVQVLRVDFLTKPTPDIRR